MQNYPNINPLIRENLNNLNEINRNNWIFTTFGDVLIIQDQGTTKPTQYNLNGLNSNY